jgi:hypothetical protein
MRIFRTIDRTTEPPWDDKPSVSENPWIPCDRCRVAQAQVEVVTTTGSIFLCEHHHKDHRASIVAAGHLILARPSRS